MRSSSVVRLLTVSLVLATGGSAFAATEFSVLTSVPETRGGTSVALSGDGTTAYVALAHGEFADDLVAIDTTINAVVERLDLNPSNREQFVLQGLVLSPDGARAYVSEFWTDHVFVVDLASFSLVDTFDLSSDRTPSVNGLAVNPDGTKLYVCQGNSPAKRVLVVDATSGLVTNSIPTGQSALHVTITPDGDHAYVTGRRRGDHFIYVVDLNSETLESTIPIGGPADKVAFTPDGEFALVSDFDGGLSRINVASGVVEERLLVGDSVLGVAVDPDGATVLVGSANADELFVVDLESFTLSQTLLIGDSLLDIKFTPEGQKAFLAYSNVPVAVLVPSSELPIPTIHYSLSPLRTASVPLDDATVAGEIFPFILPLFPSSAVNQVRFWIDDSAMLGLASQVEFNPPFDAGGGSAAQAFPVDVGELPNGTHCLTALIDFADLPDLVTHAEFTVAPDIPKPADELTQDEVDLLKQILPHIQFIEEDDGAGGTVKTIRFTGVNIEVSGGTIIEK